jgi:hypothetical protein
MFSKLAEEGIKVCLYVSYCAEIQIQSSLNKRVILKDVIDAYK